MNAAEKALALKTKQKEAVSKISQSGNFKGLKPDEISSALGAWQDRITGALGNILTPERFIQMSTQIIASNPQIAECSAPSIIGALTNMAVLNFPPVSNLGYAYLVPYNRKIGDRWVKEAQFQLGYKGMIELARRSGDVKSIHCFVVVEGDEFEYELGLKPHIKHKPCGEVANPDGSNILYSYAVVEYTNGGKVLEVLPKKRIEQLRLRSPMQQKGINGAWKTDYEAMAKAKAIKQLSKMFHLTIDQAKAFATDEKVISVDNFKNGEADVDGMEDIPYAEEVIEDVDIETGEVKQ